MLMVVRVKPNPEYDCTDSEVMAQINSIFEAQGLLPTWDYSVRDDVVTLILPYGFDTSILLEYGVLQEPQSGSST